MDIEERVTRLERQNRNLKKGIILAVIFIGGFFGPGQMSPESNEGAINNVALTINFYP